jgi:CheY-like chemotaxis protein
MVEKKRQRTALVVDDAPGVRLTVKAYLEPEGYDVLTASDAESALRQCKDGRVDLIILDIMLPGSVQGSDVLSRLRKKSVTASIPVIAISGLSAYEEGLRSIDPNIKFLAKPFTKEQFLQVLGE